jgi:hypothetical protein
MFRGWEWMFVFGVFCAVAKAAPPWSELVSLETLDADPKKPYKLTEEHGPWMIVAASFSGEGAEKQASELVLELRKRYKLPAYSYQGKFEPGEAQGLVRYDKYGQPMKYSYLKYKDEKDKEKARCPEVMEFAVLVGNFQANDDEDIQKALKKVKFAAPQCLDVKDGKKTHQSLVGWRLVQKQINEALGTDQKEMGPMSHAFISTNPILPPEYFNQKNGVDELVLALNKDVPFDLLDCQGKYTVQVATFRGHVVIKQEEIRAIENGEKEMKSALATAAEKADKLCRALREKGYEAYQFHDRNASIVTVGSFDSVGTPRQDGKIEIDPRIHKIMNVFGGESITLPGKAVPTTKLQTLVGIPFDIQAIPVQVPKRSISVAMRKRAE